MKKCPYCGREIGYAELMKYSMGSGIVKYDTCNSCGEEYKITMNVIFLLIICAVLFVVIMFILAPESRGLRRIALFGGLVAIVPLFPVFMNIGKK